MEDDTKSLQVISSIYFSVVLFGGITREDCDARAKSYHAIKKALDNKLVGSRRQIRALLIDRVLLQHENRMLERRYVGFTEAHLKVAIAKSTEPIL
jgi:hypothetical protein